MSYYQRHVFFCLNVREDGTACCGRHNAAEMQQYAKSRIKQMGLNGEGGSASTSPAVSTAATTDRASSSIRKASGTPTSTNARHRRDHRLAPGEGRSRRAAAHLDAVLGREADDRRGGGPHRVALDWPEQAAPRGIAYVGHPHPLYGGTLDNKVASTIARTFAALGWLAVRPNFRGVGRSQGKFDRGEGELSGEAAALDWLQTWNPNAPQCWIAGFSFGAWIGMQLLMRRTETSGFISVAPPGNIYDFSFLAPCPSSGLVIQGDQDNVVPQESVQKLVTKLTHQRGIKIDYQIVPGASHFFTEHLDQLTRICDTYLDTALPEAAAKSRAGK